MGEPTVGSFSVEGSASAGSELDEGGRGARKRGSGAGGGCDATVGCGMRGMGKSSWAICRSMVSNEQNQGLDRVYLVDARYDGGQ